MLYLTVRYLSLLTVILAKKQKPQTALPPMWSYACKPPTCHYRFNALDRLHNKFVCMSLSVTVNRLNDLYVAIIKARSLSENVVT